MVEQLIAGRAALIRADLPAGEYLADTPKSARLAVLGVESQPLAAREIVAALDAQGRWLAPGARRNPAPQITTGAFIANLGVLCDYLEAVK